MIGKIKNVLQNKAALQKKMQWFSSDKEKFEELNDDRFRLESKNDFPCVNDKTETTGFDAHYVYHPAWAMRILAKTKPEKHVDIASTLHFCAQLSAFIPTEFYDYRPAKLTLSNLSSGEADLTKLHFEDNSIISLSCMHTVEHIGLGRYGDPIDPTGDKKAIEELKRVTAKGGDLLFVVPTGKAKLQFNAHRIYSYEMISELFKDFELKEFSLVTDDGDFVRNADKELADKQNYGCGCYWFKKPV